MIQKNCTFQKGRDIIDVVPDQSPNITESIRRGLIESRDMPSLFNELTTGESIGRKARDVFDMVSYTNSVKRLRGEARKDAEKV